MGIPSLRLNEYIELADKRNCKGIFFKLYLNAIVRVLTNKYLSPFNPDWKFSLAMGSPTSVYNPNANS